ncbi:MAG: TetR/AcrR family transcriptional regulator [Acidobacteria bacterium]|nr:TetR/AcrR family transcriptional regulator [Acidobacteriota bacterium]
MTTLPRSRLSATERRAHLVNVAVDLFAQRGFRGVTTRELAAAAGVTEPVLYQHFETKRALYDAILESKGEGQETCETAALIHQAAEDGDNLRFFRLLGTAILNWYTDDPRYARLLMFSSLERHELADLFFQRTVAAFYDVLTPYIQKQIGLGVFSPTDPLVAARIFAGMIAHQGVIFSIYCPGHLPGTKEQIVQTAVQLFLKGMSK